MKVSTQSEGFFSDIGEAVGAVIAWLSSIGGGIAEAFGSFFSGVARGSGLENAGWATWATVILGVLLLGMAVRSLLEKEIAGAVVRGLIGLALIAWAMS